MANSKEAIISNCEKSFVIKSLLDYERLDGRSFDEFRDLHIKFGKDWGSCFVSLGKTSVLATVSCEIQQAKSSRPSEGILYINVELSPLAAVHFEAGRQSDLSVQLNRTLEKCIKDSKAVDLESLCIKVNEKVWAFRVDINVTNHDGNIIDCASVAALAALAHFRRPDVTSDGEKTIIHTYAQRDPIPTVIHHYPVSISYSIFNQGKITIADPSILEEGVAEAHLTLSVNSFSEICGLHLGGSAFMSPEDILNCASKAAGRAKILVEQIKACLKENVEMRERDESGGFERNLRFEELSLGHVDFEKCMDEWVSTRKKSDKLEHVKQEIKPERPVAQGVQSLGAGTAILVIDSDEDDKKSWFTDSDADSDVVEVPVTKSEVVVEKDAHNSASEEDEVMILNTVPERRIKKKKTSKVAIFNKKI